MEEDEEEELRLLDEEWQCGDKVWTQQSLLLELRGWDTCSQSS